MKAKMFPSDLQNWPIFCLLEPKFLLDIRMAVVYGALGDEALMITKDQMVYALGSNANGCLGTGCMFSTICPKKVEALCNKDIKTFAYGRGPHVLALTNSGKVYSWGHNNYSQLGNAYTTGSIPFPVLVETKIDENFIVDIACGSFHSLALTIEGTVYAWGQNNYGQAGGENTIQNVPQRICSTLVGKKIISISCGATSSFAVTDNGEVYGWGCNECGQLGINERSNKKIPCLVKQLVGVAIEKIVCGYSHTLALTDQGNLYTWGGNDHGQLGCGDLKEHLTPTKVEVTARKKVLDIAASHYNYISVAMTEGNRIFIWGECLGQSITLPMFVPVEYMHHTFAFYATSRVTNEPVILNEEDSMSLADCLREAFNDQATSDVVIKVKDKPVYAHKAVLRIRSQYFRTLLDGDVKTENDRSVIPHDEFSYDVYNAFLKYLYTGEFDLSVEDTLELLTLAVRFSENELKEHCIRVISKAITIENVATVYHAAVQHNAEELEERCLKFACNHMTAVVQTASFSELDVNTTKAFLIKVGKAGAFRR